MGVKPNNNQKISQLEKCFESQQIENEIPKRRNNSFKKVYQCKLDMKHDILNKN